MKQYKVLKIVFILCMIVLAIVLYELVGICMAYRKQPEVTEKTKQEVQPADFYTASKNAERASIIEKNEDALLQRIRLIKSAKKELVLSTFSFHADESGKIVIGALLEAADRGVQVRILTDGFESWTAMEGNPYFYGMSSNENIEIKLYNRVNPFKPWKMMGRMHDKYLIADGQNYILGGRNTFNYFLGNYPGHKNFDRDVLVVCEKPQKENSVCQLTDYFENIWKLKDCRYFHEKARLGKRTAVKEAAADARACYKAYYETHQEQIEDSNYVKDTFETEKITLLCNPTHTGAKEPVVWYQLGELMKYAKERVKIHTPYIICDDMMYQTWREIADEVPEFTVMTNSVANNGNAFGAADYAKNRDKIMDTGITIQEYEGGYSYHGKSILIDDDLSVVGSFNMDMRSAYLDTELMLVVHSKEVNKQLEESMLEYEKVSRKLLADGTYDNPYEVVPIELTKKRERRIFLVQHLLSWARFLF